MRKFTLYLILGSSILCVASAVAARRQQGSYSDNRIRMRNSERKLGVGSAFVRCPVL